MLILILAIWLVDCGVVMDTSPVCRVQNYHLFSSPKLLLSWYLYIYIIFHKNYIPIFIFILSNIFMCVCVCACVCLCNILIKLCEDIIIAKFAIIQSTLRFKMYTLFSVSQFIIYHRLVALQRFDISDCFLLSVVKASEI